MKVGWVLDGLDPKVGGGFTYYEDLFHGIIEVARESGHFFKLLCPSERSFAVDSLDLPPSVELIRVTRSFRTSLRRKIDRCGNLLRRILPWTSGEPAETQPEVVVSAQKAGIEFMICSMLDSHHPGIMDVPFVFVLWDLQHLTMPWFPEVSADGEWERREYFLSRALRRAAFVVVGTQTGADDVTRFYDVPRERIRILPHATPSFCLNVRADEIDGSPYPPPGSYILYPSQFWPHKNHALLVDMLGILDKISERRIDLCLVGSDRGNMQHIRGLAKEHDLQDRIDFIGFVDRSELMRLYRNAIALVYPSFGGPENLPPLEAFALGCPVIAADIPGVAEQLGDAAVSVNPNDPAAWARAVLSVHDNAEFREKLIQRGKNRARRWTRVDLARGLVAIFDEFEAVRRCW